MIISFLEQNFSSSQVIHDIQRKESLRVEIYIYFKCNSVDGIKEFLKLTKKA